MEWKEYVDNLIKEIVKVDSAVIVGITGSYLRRESNNKCLRVYMNGGRTVDIPLSERKFTFHNYSSYWTDSDKKRISTIKDTLEEDKYAWKKDDYALLKEYLEIMDKATKAKFAKYQKSQDVKKERMYQTSFFKNGKNKDYCIVDIEFQSIEEMNYYPLESEKAKWLKEHPDRVKVHCGKPDYIAISEKGFWIMELKTNAEACKPGGAGLKEHNDDIDHMIEVNKKNHVLAKELKARLEILVQYKLIKKEFIEMAKKIIAMDDSEISLEKKYLFITNEHFTKEKCENELRNNGIDSKLAIIE